MELQAGLVTYEDLSIGDYFYTPISISLRVILLTLREFQETFSMCIWIKNLREEKVFLTE